MSVETETINRVLSADVLTLMAVLLVMVGGVLLWVARGMTKQNQSAGDVSLKVLSLHERQVDALTKLNSAIDAQTVYIRAQTEAEGKHQGDLVRTLSDVADVLAYIKKGLHDVLVGENKTHEGLTLLQKTTAGTADKLDSVMSKLAQNGEKLDAVAVALATLPGDIGGAIERGLSGSLKDLIKDEIEKILKERAEYERVAVVGGGDAVGGADSFDVGANERGEAGSVRDGHADGGNVGAGDGNATSDGGGIDSGSGQ